MFKFKQLQLGCCVPNIWKVFYSYIIYCQIKIAFLISQYTNVAIEGSLHVKARLACRYTGIM